MNLRSSTMMITTSIASLALFLPAVFGQCTLQCASGTCLIEEGGNNKQYCDCFPGFVGELCDTALECTLPCESGVCLIEDGSNKQYCDCLLGFVGELCETRLDPSCTICSDGTYSFKADKFIPYLRMTCFEFQLDVASGGGEERCSLARQTAAWCECPGAEPTCSLCPDGKLPVNADLMVSESENLSCSDYVFLAAITPQGPKCQDFDYLAEFCGGCSMTPHDTDSQQHCLSLCPDGSNVPIPGAILFDDDNGTPITCGEAQDVLSSSDPIGSCLLGWYLGVSTCGCDDTLPLVPQDSLCSLCEDGTAPPDVTVQLVEGLTCRDFAYLFANEEEACPALQATAGVYCGCDNPEASEGACRICGDRLLPDFGRIADAENRVSCGELEFLASQDHCTETQVEWAGFCCATEAPTRSPSPTETPVPTTVPDDQSRQLCLSLCPDGSNVPNRSAIIFDIENDGDQPVTCGQVQDSLEFSDPTDSCILQWYLGVTRCGCDDTLPIVPLDVPCSLCEDGTAPPNLSVHLIDNFTCRDFAYQLANEEEACTAVQATAGVYCGCDNPKASEGACRICGDRLLPDVGRIADPENGASCGELEFLANQNSCTKTPDVWAAICCATEAPSRSPSPTVTPGSTRTVFPSAYPTATPFPTMSEAPSTTAIPTGIVEREYIFSSSASFSTFLACAIFTGTVMLLI